MRTLLLALICLLAAGCMNGSGSSDAESADARLTKAEYIEQADAICARFDSELDALAQPQTLDDLAAMATEAKPIAEAGVDELRALNPPEELEEQVDAWLVLNEKNIEAIDQLREAAESGDETKVQQVAATATDNEQKADAAAADIGLTDCASTDE
jgi:hypothetical protein